MGHVAQAESDGHAIEVVVGERQLFRIGLDKFDIAGHALVEQAVTTDLEHRAVDVRQYHLAGRTHELGEFGRQVARTAGDIQYAVAGAYTRQLDGEALPQAVHAAGEHVVHQVVLGRYG